MSFIGCTFDSAKDTILMLLNKESVANVEVKVIEGKGVFNDSLICSVTQTHIDLNTPPAFFIILPKQSFPMSTMSEERVMNCEF